MSDPLAPIRRIASGDGLCSEDTTQYAGTLTVTEALSVMAEVERLTAERDEALRRVPNRDDLLAVCAAAEAWAGDGMPFPVGDANAITRVRRALDRKDTP